jgi:sec-independent protein translocase protein TatC
MANEPEAQRPETENEEEEGGPVKSFLDHLEDLRWTIIKSGSALFIGMLGCLLAAKRIIALLSRPMEKAEIHTGLQLLDPLGGFMVSLRLAFYSGLVLGLPFILYFIGQFVVPALKKKEKQYFLRAFGIGTLFFFAGVLACYFFFLPLSLRALVAYNQYLGFSTDIWRGEAYFEFATKFMLGVGLIFEVPVLILTLVRLEIVSHDLLVKWRRYMFAINFIFCAVITPADLVTTFMLALGLQVLYEGCIWISRYWEKQRRATEVDLARANELRTMD